MSLLKAALYYQKMGFSIIPVKQDKKPFVKWEQYQTEKAGPDQIQAWWVKWPSANIGLVTGQISGIDVVDCDSKNGRDALNEFLPDSLLTPIARTPGGGLHYYFKYQKGLVNRARVITDTDVRTNGGYIIAAPSIGKNGTAYEWLADISIAKVKPAPMPEILFSVLQAGAPIQNANSSEQAKNGIKTSSRTGDSIYHDNNRQQPTTFDNIAFGKGSRDETLFYLANHLVKGGMPDGNIRKYLLFFASNCKPPFPEKEAIVKIESALKRKKTSEKGLTEEIRDLILTTSGNISTTFVYNCQHLTTRDNKKKALVILGRFVKEGLIERTGRVAGEYRRIEDDCEAENWQDASTETVKIWLPFDLETIAEIQPGSLIVIAGEPNSGKTAVLMNVAKENMRRFKVHYFSSELGKSGFKRRVDKFPDISVDQWDINFYPRADNFADVVKSGDGNLNLIDYLEMYDNFYLVSKHLADIYKKLDGAIAVIGLQKNPGQDDGRGGTFTREKPVLSLALGPGKVKITKLKEWREGQDNPNNKEYHFKLVEGCRFIKVNGWHYPVIT